MCQRYSFIIRKDEMLQSLRYIKGVAALVQSYNVVPGQLAAVIANDKPNEIQHFSWGLIPEAAKNNLGRNLINARREVIATSISFRMPVREKRCLILADSFYAWQQRGTYAAPFRIRKRDETPMVFAGVWDLWQNPNGGDIKSFAIITKTAPESLAAITNRIPLLLDDPGIQQQWLKQMPLEKVMHIINNNYRDDLQFYQIPDSINSLTYNEPDLHDEVLDPQPEFNDI